MQSPRRRIPTSSNGSWQHEIEKSKGPKRQSPKDSVPGLIGHLDFGSLDVWTLNHATVPLPSATLLRPDSGRRPGGRQRLDGLEHSAQPGPPRAAAGAGAKHRLADAHEHAEGVELL